MARRNWQAASSATTAREVRQKSNDLDSWLREYDRPSPMLARPKPPPRYVAPSVVMLNGAWHAYVHHGNQPAPVVGSEFDCMQARTRSRGRARVLAVVWTQQGRSLVRVERA